MRKVLRVVTLVFVAFFLWVAAWYAMMADDVARVKATLAYHNEQFRQKRSTVNLKYDAVYATGFPFAFKVAIDRPTLSMVDGDESFAASFRHLTLERVDRRFWTYRVNLPLTIEALYAKSGSAPEHYISNVDQVPDVLLSAQDDKSRCGFGTDKVCQPLGSQLPLISILLRLPKSLNVTMALNGESRTANFPIPSLNAPVFQTVPEDVAWPLQLFVGVHREALVFKTGLEKR
jgi:hypothetical protein